MLNFFLGIIFVLAITALIYGYRVCKKYKRKKSIKNSYMIQNVDTKLIIRPLNAGIENGVEIIQYRPKNWDCTTWEFIEIEKNKYFLKNLWTHKGFEKKDDGSLIQNELGGKNQHYILEKSENGVRIKLAGSNLYITASDNKVNSKLVLKKWRASEKQLWILVRQNPIV